MSDDRQPSNREQALAKLAESRSQLRQQMSAPHGLTAVLSQHGLSGIGRWRGRLSAWWRFARLRSQGQPVLSMAMGAIEQWWHHHPWRTPSEFALMEARAQLGPMVKRHPLRSVALAASLGALMVAFKPWRFEFLNRQLTPIPHRVGGWLLQELKRLPLQAFITRLLLMAAANTRQASTSPVGTRPGAAVD